MLLISTAAYFGLWRGPVDQLVRKDEILEIAMLDVEQGDGFVLRMGNALMILDGGTEGGAQIGEKTLLPYLRKEGVEQVRYWVISHTDQDHCGGLIELLQEEFPIEQIILGKGEGNRENGTRIIKMAEKNGIKIKLIENLQAFSMGNGVKGMFFTIHADGNNGDINEESLVFYLEYGSFSGLFTGDLGESGENILMNLEAFPQNIFFLKVGHHGSRFSTSAKWLSRLSPKLAWISAGSQNNYGHPHPDVLKRLEEVGAFVQTTPAQGFVMLRTDGKWMEILDGGDLAFADAFPYTE